MNQAVSNFLADEDTASNRVLGSIAAIMAVGFVVAISAIAFLK